MTNRIKTLCYCSLFIAVTTIATMSLHIPVPATNGYIHLGDSIILLVAFFFGRKYGVVSAGIGSALADILVGYAHWALFTLIIKGLMALIVASLSDYHKPIISFRNVSAVFFAETVMVFGYFVSGTMLLGSPMLALQEVPANLVQASGALLVFSVAAVIFKKSSIANYFRA